MASINTTTHNATNTETMDSSNNSTLFKATARNLREYHGVPSMTADNLEKTMVLLRLRPGRLVVQGLAPKKLLKGNSAAEADADTTDSSGSSGSEVEPEQADDNQVSDDSNSNSSDSGDTNNDNIRKHDCLGFETKTSKHPVHAALVAAGITLLPRETRPLLRALGVGPHRLVKLGLVQREELRQSWPGGTRGGPPSHLRHGHPGGPGGRGHHHHRGGRGMGRPRHGPPPHGPPPHRHVHVHGKRSAHRDHRRSSGPVHGPPHGPFQESGRHLHHGPGHHHHHGGDESEEEEDEIAMMHAGPRGPPHGIPPPPHLRGQHGGPRPHGMPMHDGETHRHNGPGHHHHPGGENEGEEEEMAMHAGPRGPPHGMPPPPHLRGQLGGPPPHGMPMHDREMRPGHHHHRDDVESNGSDEEDGTEMCMVPRAHPPPHGHPRGDGGKDGHSGHHDKSHLDSDGDDFMATHWPAGPPPGSPSRGRFHEDNPDGNDNAQEHHQPPPPPPVMPMQPC
ncbi:unnamed protein product [Ectocarpus sp. 6 AP-2014]